MFRMHHLLLPVCLVAVVSTPASAQSEAELRNHFEGKSVRVKLDMPATQAGIDVYPDAGRPVDFTQYSARVKSAGIAIKSGDSVLVTRVRVKDKLIEFQLAGGGFGTFGDDTDTSVTVPPVPKTNREKDLEKLVKTENDEVRKRRVQRELDDLRTEREREDRRNRASAAGASETKKTRIATDRLHSGSRFNIRYQNGVPAGLHPDGIMRVLAEYVEFPSATDRPQGPSRQPALPATPDRRQVAGTGAIHKGMTMAEVEQALGKPDKTSDKNEGSLKLVTSTYTRDDQRIVTEFVEGVLIRYSISSK